MSEETRTSLANLYAQLRAPLPDEAIIADNSRGFLLTGLKGAYVVERLNDVFGLCGMGWKFEVAELQVENGWATCSLLLYFRVLDEWSAPIPGLGDKQMVKNRVGDAMKSAISDALKKAASFLGVGERAYKGLLTPPASGKNPPPPPPGRAKHWIDDDKVRNRFWAFAKGTLKLTAGQVYKALNVKQMHDFTDTMKDAKRLLEEAASGPNQEG